VIGSRVKGVEGYTDLMSYSVDAGDALVLRDAVNKALSDRTALRARVDAVRDLAATRPYSLYIEQVRNFLIESSAVARPMRKRASHD